MPLQGDMARENRIPRAMHGADMLHAFGVEENAEPIGFSAFGKTTRSAVL